MSIVQLPSGEGGYLVYSSNYMPYLRLWWEKYVHGFRFGFQEVVNMIYPLRELLGLWT